MGKKKFLFVCCILVFITHGYLQAENDSLLGGDKSTHIRIPHRCPHRSNIEVFYVPDMSTIYIVFNEEIEKLDILVYKCGVLVSRKFLCNVKVGDYDTFYYDRGDEKCLGRVEVLIEGAPVVIEEI